MTEAISLREIVIERTIDPAGRFLVVMRHHDCPDGEFCRLWESAELAFAEADYLKRNYGPAVIRDWTGGVR